MGKCCTVYEIWYKNTNFAFKRDSANITLYFYPKIDPSFPNLQSSQFREKDFIQYIFQYLKNLDNMISAIGVSLKLGNCPI